MAKLINPLFSFEARGSIGRALTYRQTRTGAISHHHQRHPRTASPAQSAHRSFFGRASKYFAALPQSLKSSYCTLYFPPFLSYSKEVSGGTLPGFSNFLKVIKTFDDLNLGFIPIQQFHVSRSSATSLNFHLAHRVIENGYYFYNISFFHFPLNDNPFDTVMHDGLGPFNDQFSYEFSPSDLPFGFTLFFSPLENCALISGLFIFS